MLFAVIGLLGFSISATAANEWLYYKHYPWVWDNKTKDWFYLSGGNGKVVAYRASTNEWEDFNPLQKTWDEQYEEWILDPEPYGGLDTLQLIKEAKESGATELRLDYRNISDLTPIAELINLETLSLWKNNITDISHLTELKNLKTLSFDFNSVTDFSYIANLSNLEYLYFFNNKPSSLTFLSELTKLKEINISVDNLDNILPLQNLVNLERLFLQGDANLDFSILDSFPKLKELYITSNLSSDFSKLPLIPQLEFLNISQSNFSDLSKIQNFVGLTGIYFQQNYIEDISALSELTNLTFINLRQNNISDISPLASLTNPETLLLAVNSISDLTPLANFNGLTTLTLNDNPVSSSQKLMLEEALPNTNITWSEFNPDAPLNEFKVYLDSHNFIEMKWVPSGTFTMGSPVGEVGRKSDETQHQVTLDGFYLGKFEVTQSQYELIMKDNNEGLSATPSNWANNPTHPVEQVSWNDTQVFINKLNALKSEQLSSGWAYALPTEAQWEYACRAGTSTPFSNGEDLNSSYANYAPEGFGSGLGKTSSIGSYLPNDWGFYDMHGNVFEWTNDWYEVLASSSQTNPTGPSSGTLKVAKGGSWAYAQEVQRSAMRDSNHPPDEMRSYHVGFRLSLRRL